jgi:Zn-dependent M28 family amino/carboxypeptidase
MTPDPALLRRHVEALAGFGPRNTRRPEALARAADYIEQQFRGFGYATRDLSFRSDGVEVRNIDVERRGGARGDDIVVVGAHYDSVDGSPGANDNASGIAAMLELARIYASGSPAVTLRFAAFVNEEPPFFMTEEMGSVAYARACRERRERLVAMYALDTIGFYTDDPGTQEYPEAFHLLFPSVGNFVAMVANFRSATLLAHTIRIFRSHSSLPALGAPAPESVAGVSWSDHWSFWQQGFPAVMLTDTAPFRYPHYHASTDTPDKLDYARMAALVAGMTAVISAIGE